VRVAAADTGGNLGRSLWLEVRSGKVLTKTTGTVPREL
jgi:chemotaxis receptor (MCP) glutamine deamidase CheD